MLVTTLGMDNFDSTKMNAHFFKNYSLTMGRAHSRVEASTSPLYVNNSWLCSTHNHSSTPWDTGAQQLQTTYCIFQLKPSPILEAPGHGHQLGQAYSRQTWAYTTSTVLATVAFLLLPDTSLLSQVGITHYSQQLTVDECCGHQKPLLR